MASLIELEQQWMCLTGPKTSCEIIHPSTSCGSQIINKCQQVVKASSKLYALLYLAMFIIRFRKIHNQRKIKQTFINFTKDYLWSLAFMSVTVGGMKTALCLLNRIGSPLDGRVIPLLSFLASPSIYCLQKSKRSEVVLFTFARSCRSLYIYFKKRYNFKIGCQKQLTFILLYGLLSYFYFEKPNTLRNKQILNNLWGQF